jgi:hypothetical protein
MMEFGEREGESCLIGYTGFVGTALARQACFSQCFNSSTIAAIAGQRFDTVVCAAAPGSMFEANRFPDRDRARIDALIDQLATVRAERFILISSIAVLADFAGGDDEGSARFQTDLAYGRHRRALEAFVESRFERHLVVRLPALFGPGLRKNFVFDLLNPVPSMLTQERLDGLAAALDAPLAAWLRALYRPDAATGLCTLDRASLNADRRRAALEDAVVALGASATQFHHRETTYQYYGIDRLWSDIGVAMDAGLSHIHLVAEPLSAASIHQHLTGRAMPETGARLHREDMRTRHAALWGASGPYQFDAETTLARLATFHADAQVAA